MSADIYQAKLEMEKNNWLDKLNLDEDHLEEVRIIGYAYIRQGKYDIALSFFEAITALQPDSAYDQQTLGALHLQMNNPAMALQCFDRALKMEGDHSPTLLNVAKAFFMLGKKDEGLKLAEILAREPNRYISNVAKALLLAYG